MSDILIWEEDGNVLLDAAEGANHAHMPVYAMSAKEARKLAIDLLNAAEEAESPEPENQDIPVTGARTDVFED